MSKEGFVIVGRIVSVCGLRGALKLLQYGDTEIDTFSNLYLSSPHGKTLSKHTVTSSRKRGRFDIVFFADVNCREDAEKLRRAEVFAKKDDFLKLPEGEYYAFELDGMNVETEDGRFIGVVSSIIFTKSNDVYVVNGPGGEVLVPAIKDCIIKINPDKRRMVVRLSEGFF